MTAGTAPVIHSRTVFHYEKPHNRSGGLVPILQFHHLLRSVSACLPQDNNEPESDRHGCASPCYLWPPASFKIVEHPVPDRDPGCPNLFTGTSSFYYCLLPPRNFFDTGFPIVINPTPRCQPPRFLHAFVRRLFSILRHLIPVFNLNGNVRARFI